jgi:hypothetical protein
MGNLLEPYKIYGYSMSVGLEQFNCYLSCLEFKLLSVVQCIILQWHLVKHCLENLVEPNICTAKVSSLLTEKPK